MLNLFMKSSSGPVQLDYQSEFNDEVRIYFVNSNKRILLDEW